MKTKNKILSIVCSAFLISTVGIGYAVTNLSEKDKVSIYENIFDKDLFSGLFNDRAANNLVINNHTIGAYRANMKLLIEEVSLSNGFRKFSKDQTPLYSYQRVEKVSGIPAIQKGKEDNYIKYYNPDFLKWGIENLYISPATKIYGVEAQDIYDKSFKDFFRLTAYSYIYLNKKKGFYKAEQKMYIDGYNAGLKANDQIYFDGVSYLYERYSKLEKTDFKSYYPDDFSYDPSTAIGFWLRRGNDKTDKVIWEGIKKVMTNYDKDWFKKNSK